jgi:quercetin dioxygenase-like cupin family protein
MILSRGARTETRLRQSVSGLWVAIAITQCSIAERARAQVSPPCPPVSERAGREIGCFTIGRQNLGKLPTAPLYWHLDVFPTIASAEAAKTSSGSVFQYYGKIWLFTIADLRWRPTGAAQQIAIIGPLPLAPAGGYAAVYLQGDLNPGRTTMPHRHPGAETWYNVEGTICLETPDGKHVQTAGGQAIVIPGGVPMQLTTIGSIVRHGFSLVLQDSTKPWMEVANDWKPQGLCLK